jgi:hypothetical protein
MATGDELEHPYSAIDVAQLDHDYLSLLARAEAPAANGAGAWGQGLSDREKRLFRFGVLVGQGEWELLDEAVGRLVGECKMGGPELERVAAEAGMANFARVLVRCDAIADPLPVCPIDGCG